MDRRILFYSHGGKLFVYIAVASAVKRRAPGGTSIPSNNSLSAKESWK